MSSPVISVKNIGKKYRLGFTHEGKGYKTFRDTIAHGVKRIVQSAKGIAGSGKSSNNQNAMHNAPTATRSQSNSRSALCPLPSAEALPHEFWALKDISFDVQQGEVLGIIGANGAGKSTLLKILSEITEPTEGEIRMKGRVASLLEVGTGFHPELSGRENVYMNGAILGMTKVEIDSKFDEIVTFAGVEKFIDTPIKRYSSGMNVRLAFAVAANLEPEILLVDEVLAVGDALFQKKCLRKMEEASHRGRTVLFVSHNMGAIQQLVSRCLLLDNGLLAFDGDKSEGVNRYLQFGHSELRSETFFPDSEPTDNTPIVIKAVALSKGKGHKSTGNFELGAPWCVEIGIEAKEKNIRFYSSLRIYNDRGVSVYHLVSSDTSPMNFLSKYQSVITVFLPKLKLYPGRYFVDVFIGRADASKEKIDKIDSAICFEVTQSSGLEVARPLAKSKGVVHEAAQWDVR